jgi:serine/threonine protein kinase
MQIPQTEVILSKDGVELTRRVVTPGEYLLGRGEDVDFLMETPLASRHHARLTVNYDEWLVEDLGSSNGTFINDQPVAPHETTRVFPTQTLRVGDATVTLRRLRGSEAPEVSLAPSVAVGRTLLPAEVRERRYAIGKVVAQGGMGAILSAQDRAIRRGVAMKVMLQSGDAGDLTRFVEEAQITGQLEHPNIVPVHELGVDEQDQFFYTMKFVDGVTLRKVLELIASGADATAKKYPLPALLTNFQKVCDAIAFAHSRRVIHRDLKPENIMLGDFGEVLVMDWGLAKVLGATAPTPDAGPRVVSTRQSEDSASMTMAGAIMGTPQYMAPEQARGEVETLDPRADIYALGAILFHLLYGRPPVSGRDAMEIVEKVQRGEVEWPPGNELRRAPESLLAVCRKTLALDPAKRYPRVEDLQADIAAYQGGFATSAENVTAWKQLRLLILRHKATSIGIAAVLLVGTTLGTKAILEGRRAEREAVRANAALKNLKAAAPDMLALAASEAGAQRFESALHKTEAALAVDPGLTAAYWRQAWILFALNRVPESITALRLAAEKDPANQKNAALLPLLEKQLALPPAEQHAIETVQPLYEHLTAVGASGEALTLVPHLQLAKDAKFKVVNEQVIRWLGKTPGGIAPPLTQFTPNNGLQVNLTGLHIGTLEPLRGLPIDQLQANSCDLTSLEPLRGMKLKKMRVSRNSLRDLSPLAGMPLEFLDVQDNDLTELSGLRGTSLMTLWLGGNKNLADLSGLVRLPLDHLGISSKVVQDYSPFRGLPLTYLNLTDSNFSDASVLAGMPLDDASLSGTPLEDLAPLAGLPIRRLQIQNTKVADLTPLLRLSKLEFLRVSIRPENLLPLRNHPTLQSIQNYNGPVISVAEFWAAYDKQKAAEKK